MTESIIRLYSTRCNPYVHNPTRLSTYHYKPVFYALTMGKGESAMNRKPQPFDEVSSGTLRDSDLLESMLDTLEYYRPVKYAKLIKEGREVLELYPDFGYLSYLHDEVSYDVDIRYADSYVDTVSGIIEDLYNAMQDISPAGCSYGSHMGDGALFGFWPDEDSGFWE